MTKLTLEQQELLFANDCKLINLRYEYHGYTGTEKWAIVTELAEEELWVKYPDVIRRYTPFILLSMAQGEVIDESYRNNDKYEKRAKRTIDVYGYEDDISEQFHRELITPFVDPFEQAEEERIEEEKEQLRQLEIAKVRKVLEMINLLVSMFPGNDPMSLQMRVSVFHVIFNVTTTCLLLPFVKQLVQYSCQVIKDRKPTEAVHTLRYIDDRLLTMTPVALMQVKKEMDHMFGLVEENIGLSFTAMGANEPLHGDRIVENETVIDFTNGALTRFLIKLSSTVEQSDELVIGSYFHVLNDLERIGDHAENFYEIAAEMAAKKIAFSEKAQDDIRKMREKVMQMLAISKDAFDNQNKAGLPKLDLLEDEIDKMKKELTISHFLRLAEGDCSMEVSPYYSSVVAGLERVADHLVNVGYSIVSPVGSQKENE